MKKRLLILTLASMMALSIAGCGKTKEPEVHQAPQISVNSGVTGGNTDVEVELPLDDPGYIEEMTGDEEFEVLQDKADYEGTTEDFIAKFGPEMEECVDYIESSTDFKLRGRGLDETLDDADFSNVKVGTVLIQEYVFKIGYDIPFSEDSTPDDVKREVEAALDRLKEEGAITSYKEVEPNTCNYIVMPSYGYELNIDNSILYLEAQMKMYR